MTVFNSLGSNYDFRFVLRSLFARSSPSDRKKLIKLLGRKYGGHAHLFYKGRDALRVGLEALQLPKGSGVFVNGLTCFAVYEAISNAGLKPVYLDIEKGSLHFSPKTLQKKVSNHKEVRAVIVQNTLGYPCDIKKIAEICKANKLILVEDLAHSVGARHLNGKEAGDFGDVVALSFSQDKLVDGVSGGALVMKHKISGLDTSTLVEIGLLRKLKDYMYPFFTILIRTLYKIGLGKLLHLFLKKLRLLPDPIKSDDKAPANLSSWHISLILERFRRLNEELNHRREIARIYATNINKNVILKDSVKKVDNSSNNRFPIVVSKRTDIIRFLKSKGVYVGDIWYDAPIAPVRLLKFSNYKRGECPVAEEISQGIINLPTHINIQEKTALEISKVINTWLNTQRN